MNTQKSLLLVICIIFAWILASCGINASPTALPTAIPSATSTSLPTAISTAIPPATPTVILTATPMLIPTALATVTPTSLDFQYGKYISGDDPNVYNDFVIQFNADGTYTSSIQDIPEHGFFTLSGNKISFKGDYCGMDVIGVYSWTFNGKELYLWGKDDNCSDRIFMIAGATFRLMP